MRTNWRTGILIVGFATLAASQTSCDEDARRLAKEAARVLGNYQAELQKKLDAEETAYRRQAQIESQAQRDQAFAMLEQERIERSRSMALDYLETSKSPARWREPLRDYAKADYGVQRQLLLEELDTDSRYLEKIQALEVDKQKIAALKRAFEALAAQPEAVKTAAGLAQAGNETITQFDRMVCAGLAAQIQSKTAEAAAASKKADVLAAAGGEAAAAAQAEAKQAKAAVESLKQKSGDRNCGS